MKHHPLSEAQRDLICLRSHSREEAAWRQTPGLLVPQNSLHGVTGPPWARIQVLRAPGIGAESLYYRRGVRGEGGEPQPSSCDWSRTPWGGQ